MASIGFIGLGNMGGPMAMNLLKAGHALKVFDLSLDALAKAKDAGATIADTAASAASDVEVVVSMLPAGQHVSSVYLEGGEVLNSVAPGTLIIDSSTIDVDTARAVNEAAAAKGLTMVDAPVSGGVMAAEAGTLTFMVGGTDEGFAAAKLILGNMGKNIFHAGGAGTGQAAKICNNMLLAISMIGTAEAFVLAEKLGLDHQKLFDISSTASGQCWSLTTYCPVPGPVPTAPSNRDYAPGFTAAMMLKDLRLSQEAAQKVRASTPMGAEAAQMYGLMESLGKEGLDFSGIIKLIRGDI